MQVALMKQHICYMSDVTGLRSKRETKSRAYFT